MKLLLIILFIVINRLSLMNDINNYLSNELAGFDSFAFEIVNKEKILYDDIKRYKILYDKEFKLAGSYGYIPVELETIQNKTYNSSILVKLNLIKSVMISVRDIELGEELDGSMFRVEKQEVSSLHYIPYDVKKKLSAKRSRMKIRKNEILAENMIEQLPIINRGDNVIAYTEKGSIRITFDALAKDNGLNGEVIRIYTKDNKYFKAEVKDSSLVKLVE